MSKPYHNRSKRSSSTDTMGDRNRVSLQPAGRTLPANAAIRTSKGGTINDYEGGHQTKPLRNPSILKKKNEAGLGTRKHSHDQIYRPTGGHHRHNRPSKDPNRPRHARFHESTKQRERKSREAFSSREKSNVSSGSFYFKSWKKSVANLLDKSQLSAVDRFRRRTLAFRTAVCIGLILATVSVIAAIVGTVYYVRYHRQPLAQPKVHVLASINGTIRLLDMDFDDTLKIRDSPRYKMLESAICSTIKDAVFDSSLCKVNKFRKGSVIADFQFEVALPSMNEGEKTGNPMFKSSQTMPDKREEIMTNITSKKLSRLGQKFDLFIDPEYTLHPEVDLFMTELLTDKVVRIADVQPVLDIKDIEEWCNRNTSEPIESETNYFADSTNCRAFLVCDGNQLYRLTCGAGTAWNDEEVTCDFKSRTNCSYDSPLDYEYDNELPEEGAVPKVILSRRKASSNERMSSTAPPTTTFKRLEIPGRGRTQLKYRFKENSPVKRNRPTRRRDPSEEIIDYPSYGPIFMDHDKIEDARPRPVMLPKTKERVSFIQRAVAAATAPHRVVTPAPVRRSGSSILSGAVAAIDDEVEPAPRRRRPIKRIRRPSPTFIGDAADMEAPTVIRNRAGKPSPINPDNVKAPKVIANRVQRPAGARRRHVSFSANRERSKS